ncbi:MAG TPA: hypothetical protein VFU31_07825 [Candidatus Binatia bacterium]|nr:hypothetical protein [Candidatus Binatia bacterium]
MNDNELHQYARNELRRKNGPSPQNNKPYRTKALKIEAAKTAYKTEGGFWRSPTPVLFHGTATKRRD